MKHILAILLAAILLFGCTQPGGGAQTGTGGTSGGTGAGGTGTGETGATGGTGTTGGETGGTTGGTTGGETGGTEGGFSMDEWSMDALIGMGTPVHCTVRYGGEYPGEYEMYILGQKMRVEGFTSYGGETNEMLMISKDNKAYMPAESMAGSPGFETCDWIYFETEETEPTTPGATSVSDFESPPVEFDCAPAVFGDEKFATPGTVCDFQQMMQQQYASYCDDLTGEAKEQCLAAFQ